MKYLGSGAGVSPTRVGGDKSLKLSLADTFRLAWADPELRGRIQFVLGVFAVYALAVHVPVPIPGVDPATVEQIVKGNQFLQLLNAFGGRALQKISLVALGLGPYITASIIMQILQTANPAMKQELKEGGEYARRKQGQRTRALTLLLCGFQGWGLMSMFSQGGLAVTLQTKLFVILFWTAGAMFMLWLGEQLTERGIGNGVSMMIFAGIVISFPAMLQQLYNGVMDRTVSVISVIALIVLFLLTTYFIVYFTIAQRKIPIQHVRRQIGTKSLGGATSYLPLSVNLVGVMPIIFAISLVSLPSQIAGFFPPTNPVHNAMLNVAQFFYPDFTRWQGWIGAGLYMVLIFFFTYFWTAIQFNVDDMVDNLKRGGSFVQGIRPGKQTKDFLDGVISRIAIVGAFFLALVSVSQYLVPVIINMRGLTMLFGTSLLIMVSVALETMRQIEANLLMRQYGG